MQMMKLTSLVVVLCLTSLTHGEDSDVEQGECGGSLSNTTFESIEKLLKYYSRCTFPTDKLNISCLLTSCPKLSGVCPLTSTGSADQNALDTAVSILNACLGDGEPICGIDMSRIPMIQLGWTTAELLPTSVVNGTVRANPGTGFLNNLSNANFTANVSPNGLIALSIQAPYVTNFASHTCSFVINNSSFLQPLAALFPSLNLFNVQEMNALLNINISSTASINITAHPPTITILQDQSDHNVVFDNFITTSGMSLPAEIVEPFNKVFNSLLEESQVTYDAANTFLSTYAALSLQAAQQNCAQ